MKTKFLLPIFAAIALLLYFLGNKPSSERSSPVSTSEGVGAAEQAKEYIEGANGVSPIFFVFIFTV
jgi:hypothetical protein